jgi:ribosome-binding ATPase YchF (GTP1/OBG family)
MFLTAKPVTFLINQSKEDYVAGKCKYMPDIKDWIAKNASDSNFIEYSAEFEKENKDISKSRVNELILAGYRLLNLIHFFTVG